MGVFDIAQLVFYSISCLPSTNKAHSFIRVWLSCLTYYALIVPSGACAVAIRLSQTLSCAAASIHMPPVAPGTSCPSVSAVIGYLLLLWSIAEYIKNIC